MVALLNRLAQRYLIRAGKDVGVSVPGPDLTAGDWWFDEAGPGGELRIMEPTPPHRVLVAVGSGLAVADAVGAVPAATWHVVSVDAGPDDAVHIVSGSDPTLGLRMMGVPDQREVLVPVTLSRYRGDDPAGVWRISDRCVADARSIHLRYRSPETSGFFNSVTPQETPPGTYFCAAGFGADSRGVAPSGYAGVQKRGDGSQLAIFSLWHRMRDETRADKTARAVLAEADPTAEQTTFSGEGAGVSMRIPFRWPDDRQTAVRFALSATADGNDTVVAARIRLGLEPWLEIGRIRRIGTGGRLLSNLYSFVEDFERSGSTPGISAALRSPYQRRRAIFHDPWLINDVGNAAPVDMIQISAYGPHPLENLSVERAGDGFAMMVATGGQPAILPSVVGETFVDDDAHRHLFPYSPEPG